jgi:hypothetical protein
MIGVDGRTNSYRHSAIFLYKMLNFLRSLETDTDRAVRIARWLMVGTVPVLMFALPIAGWRTSSTVAESLGVLVTFVAAMLFLLALYVQREELRANVAEVKRMAGEMELDRLGREVESFCTRWNMMRGRIHLAERMLEVYVGNEAQSQEARNFTNSFVRQPAYHVDHQQRLFPLLDVARGALFVRASRVEGLLQRGDLLDLGDLPEIGTLCAELNRLAAAVGSFIDAETDNTRRGEIERLADRLALTVEGESEALWRIEEHTRAFGDEGEHVTLAGVTDEAVRTIRRISDLATRRHNKRVAQN